MSDDWALILKCLKTVSGKSGSFWASDTVDTHLSCPFLFLMKFAWSHKNRHLIHLSDSLINYWTLLAHFKGSGYCLWTYAYHFLWFWSKCEAFKTKQKTKYLCMLHACMEKTHVCFTAYSHTFGLHYVAHSCFAKRGFALGLQNLLATCTIYTQYTHYRNQKRKKERETEICGVGGGQFSLN